MATKQRKATTVADLIAASKVGAVDPSTVVLTAEDAEAAIAAAQREAAAANAVAMAAAAALGEAVSTTEHHCGIAGCRHGEAHPVVSQPDRQVKLQCPHCGAVARMTNAALAKSGGLTCATSGVAFAPAARRAYRARS